MIMFSDVEKVMPRDKSGRPDYSVFDVFAWRECNEAERLRIYNQFKAKHDATIVKEAAR